MFRTIYAKVAGFPRFLSAHWPDLVLLLLAWVIYVVNYATETIASSPPENTNDSLGASMRKSWEATVAAATSIGHVFSDENVFPPLILSLTVYLALKSSLDFLGKEVVKAPSFAIPVYTRGMISLLLAMLIAHPAVTAGRHSHEQVITLVTLIIGVYFMALDGALMRFYGQDSRRRLKRFSGLATSYAWCHAISLLLCLCSVVGAFMSSLSMGIAFIVICTQILLQLLVRPPSVMQALMLPHHSTTETEEA